MFRDEEMYSLDEIEAALTTDEKPQFAEVLAKARNWEKRVNVILHTRDVLAARTDLTTDEKSERDEVLLESLLDMAEEKREISQEMEEVNERVRGDKCTCPVCTDSSDLIPASGASDTDTTFNLANVLYSLLSPDEQEELRPMKEDLEALEARRKILIDKMDRVAQGEGSREDMTEALSEAIAFRNDSQAFKDKYEDAWVDGGSDNKPKKEEKTDKYSAILKSLKSDEFGEC